MNPQPLIQPSVRPYGYKILSHSEDLLTYGDFRLVSLREEDIFLIKDWRNTQIDVLRQKRPLTEEDQRRYFDSVVQKSFSDETPNIILFSFLQNGECIGYGGLVHIDWESRQAEVSFLLNPKFTGSNAVYAELFQTFLTLLSRAAFEILSFNRLFTETFNIRTCHIQTLESFGFQREGCLKEHVYIQNRFVDSLMHGLLCKDWKAMAEP